MKKYLLMMALGAMAFLSQAQTTTTADRVVARQAMYLRNRWIDSVHNDTTDMLNQRAIMTNNAIRRFVEARIAANPVVPYVDSLWRSNDSVYWKKNGLTYNVGRFQPYGNYVTGGSNSFIQNQYSSAQAADQWILGTARFGGQVTFDKPVRLPSFVVDPSGAVNGDEYYNSATDKGRLFTSGAFQNIATEPWVQSAIQTGRYIYVDANNPFATDVRAAGLSNYSMLAPFKTIQAAINASNGNLKEIIYVRPGTYNENITSVSAGGYGYAINTNWAYDYTPTIVLDGAIVEGGAASTFTFLGNYDVTMYVLNGAWIKNTGVETDKDATAALRTHDARIKLYGNSTDLSKISSINAHAVKLQVGSTSFKIERMTLASTKGSGLQAVNTGYVSIAHSVITSDESSGIYGGARVGLNTCTVSGFNGIDFVNQAPGHNYLNSTIIGTGNAAIVNTEMGGSSTSWGLAHNCTFQGYNNVLNWRSSSNVHQFQFDNCRFTLTNPAATVALYWEEPWHYGGAGSVTKTNNTVSTHPLFTDWLRTNHPDYIKESNTNTSTTIFFGINTGFGTPAPTSQVDIKGVNGYSQLRLQTKYTPTSSADTNGNPGDVAVDDNYIYYKTASGWKRTALATF